MKSMSQLQTVSDIKGMHSIGARSIPKAMRSSYLELYVLDREKARLEKEKFSLDKRGRSAQTRLDSISQRMEKIKKEIEEETDVTAQRRVTSRRPLKTMSIKY
jgi:predicted  nucleic acid-binding Zn-ribbon protein